MARVGPLTKIEQNGNGDATIRLSLAAKLGVMVMGGLLVSAIVGNIAMFRTIGVLETRQVHVEQESDAHILWSERVRREYVSREEFAATIKPMQDTLARVEDKIDALASRRD